MFTSRGQLRGAEQVCLGQAEPQRHPLFRGHQTHTTFFPDWWLGLLKPAIPTHICRLPGRSCSGCQHLGHHPLVGCEEGETIVPMYMDCNDCGALQEGEEHEALPILRFGQVFTRCCECPVGIGHRGRVHRASRPGLVTCIVLFAPSQPPSGLSHERQVHLHNTIREYCPHEVRIHVFPRPLTPPVTTTHCPTTTRTSSISASTSSGRHLPAKKLRLCGNCKELRQEEQ